ncbi:hypothetical protein B0H16DRAFT_1712710 [Mycena metata]|uniref:DUF6533 domain-containing protein n=1 Tax=Mycena metata TaxID=1033252 RepID=A0AAD7K1I1_9AGAR|nr:hypothetical protein B0H16DRAFT_1712710 [Mycena metata]
MEPPAILDQHLSGLIIFHTPRPCHFWAAWSFLRQIHPVLSSSSSTSVDPWQESMPMTSRKSPSYIVRQAHQLSKSPSDLSTANAERPTCEGKSILAGAVACSLPLAPTGGMATEDAAQAAELLQLIADSRLTGYTAVAALCVLLHDHLVELMWSSRWGLAKIVYLWNRYFSLIAISLNTSVIVREIGTDTAYVQDTNPDYLGADHWVQGITSTIVIAAVDFVLMLRVWIMYGRPRLLIWLFAFLGLGEIVTMVTVDFFAYAEMKRYVHLGPILKGCYAYNVPRFLNIYAAAPLVVTFIMFGLTLFKCARTFRERAHQVMPVWRLFLRDGIVWFLAVFLAAGTALLLWTIGRETLKQLLVVPSLVVYSTVASRTLLNIKAIMAQDPLATDRSELKTGEQIVFVSINSSRVSSSMA